jgi:hypothetical protein
MKNDKPPKYEDIEKDPQVDKLLDYELADPPPYRSLFKKTVNELREYQKSN